MFSLRPQIDTKKINVEPMIDKNEITLSHVNGSMDSIKTANKVKIISRAIQDDRQAAPVFGTNKTNLLSASYGEIFKWIIIIVVDFSNLNKFSYKADFLKKKNHCIDKMTISTTTLTRTGYFLDRLTYTHAILGESIYMISS